MKAFKFNLNGKQKRTNNKENFCEMEKKIIKEQPMAYICLNHRDRSWTLQRNSEENTFYLGLDKVLGH